MKKLRLQGISTQKAANAFLRQRYLPGHQELDRTFCLQEERVISNDWVIHYEGRTLQLERRSRYAPAGQRVIVREDASGRLRIDYRGQRVNWKEVVAHSQPTAIPTPVVRAGIRRTPRPASADHPWKRWASTRSRALPLAPGSPTPGLPSASSSPT